MTLAVPNQPQLANVNRFSDLNAVAYGSSFLSTTRPRNALWILHFPNHEIRAEFMDVVAKKVLNSQFEGPYECRSSPVSSSNLWLFALTRRYWRLAVCSLRTSKSNYQLFAWLQRVQSNDEQTFHAVKLGLSTETNRAKNESCTAVNRLKFRRRNDAIKSH